MIEIATCMNDLSKGAVWVRKTNAYKVVRLVSVWLTGNGNDKAVGFEIWDSRSDVEAWSTSATMDADAFEAEYKYAKGHVLNEAREAEKVKHVMNETLSKLSNCMDVELRAEGRELLKTLVKLSKLSAGYDVLTHEWDEGCVGSGCCADTAEMAGDFLVDENSLTDDEIQSLLS